MPQCFICCFKILQEDDELYDLQEKEWKPVIEWFCERFGVNIEAARQITGPVITDEAKETIKKHLLSHNLWSIFGKCFSANYL